MKVSVLTPSYNYGKFIGTHLRSVAAQAPGCEVEHIIVDAGSTDNTVRQLLETETIWISEKDDGQSDALNKALALASGDWIAWLNADEYYLPDGLATLVAQCGDADVIYGDFLECGPDFMFHRYVASRPVTSFGLRNYGTIVKSCSVLMRRDSLPTPTWSVDKTRVMDWELWLRMREQGARFKYVPRPVGVFTIHGANVTADGARPRHPEVVDLENRFGVAAVRPGSWARRQLGRAEHLLIKAVKGGKLREARFGRLMTGSSLDWTNDRSVEDRLRYSL